MNEGLITEFFAKLGKIEGVEREPDKQCNFCKHWYVVIHHHNFFVKLEKYKGGLSRPLGQCRGE